MVFYLECKPAHRPCGVFVCFDSNIQFYRIEILRNEFLYSTQDEFLGLHIQPLRARSHSSNGCLVWNPLSQKVLDHSSVLSYPILKIQNHWVMIPIFQIYFSLFCKIQNV
ncbi:MAG: hypothetical protein CK427_14165 [Leptospira sp.]|nr:MAG: hypothetical protein CK427_14165 [Leptospira sp.]